MGAQKSHGNPGGRYDGIFPDAMVNTVGHPMGSYTPDGKAHRAPWGVPHEKFHGILRDVFPESYGKYRGTAHGVIYALWEGRSPWEFQWDPMGRLPGSHGKYRGIAHGIMYSHGKSHIGSHGAYNGTK